MLTNSAPDLIKECGLIFQDVGEWTVQSFKEGTTNHLYGCFPTDDQLKHKAIVFRLFGQSTHLFIDRQSEYHYMCQFFQLGLAPPVFRKFTNGYAYGYIPGRTLETPEIGKPVFVRAIAKQLALFHQSPVKPYKGSSEPTLISVMENYLKVLSETVKALEEKHPVADLARQLQRAVSSATRRIRLRFDQSASEDKVVFCHNDLLAKNVIVPTEPEGSGDNECSVKFIDFEYSGFNYASYDIANHLNEYAGMEHADFSLIPKGVAVAEWCQIYAGFAAVKSVAELVDDVIFFMPVSHLFWSLWALLQHFNSTKGFDFLPYVPRPFNPGPANATNRYCEARFALFNRDFMDCD